jgi:hypothetical protein
MGRIKSLPRVVKHNNQKGTRRFRKTRILKPWKSVSSRNPLARKFARYMVSLRKNGDTQRAAIGFLVLSAFVGPKPKNHCVCHDPNPDTSINRVTNIKWGTLSINSQDSVRHGTCNFVGERNPSVKITPDDARQIRSLYATGNYFMRHLAEKFGISLTTIHDIIHRKIWKQVP